MNINQLKAADFSTISGFYARESEGSNNYYSPYREILYLFKICDAEIEQEVSQIFGPLRDNDVYLSVIAKNCFNHYYQFDTFKRDYVPVSQKVLEELVKNPFLVKISGGVWGQNAFEPSQSLVDLFNTADELRYLGFCEKRHHSHHHYNIGNSNIAVSVTHNDTKFIVIMPFEFAEYACGLHVTKDLKLKISNGIECDFSWVKDYLNTDGSKKPFYRFDYSFRVIDCMRSSLGVSQNCMNQLLDHVDHSKFSITEPKDLSGIKKNWSNLAPFIEELRKTNPLKTCTLLELANHAGQSVDGVKLSVVFNHLFENVKSEKDLLNALKPFPITDTDWSDIENRIKTLDFFKAKRKLVLKSQANRAFTKIVEESESLTIDRSKHKRTWSEIQAGNISIGTFFRKSEQYFLLNDNWDLWEEMFKRGFREETINLAKQASGRTRYEKDLMSYFYFVLYALPEYLKKHTGVKWKCIPKLVDSSEELEPPKEGDDGIVRTRSALTPYVDNENHTVVVPYASLRIGGCQTTYCYSHDYHLLTRGMSFNGNVVVRDIEEKLNGRDDYGLMFYTFTGSEQGRGYPTFLIIFERRERFNDTRVHFHRTHPFRSKDGDYNPIHQWVAGCYNWMAGNIKADRIKAQQGDLFFVQIKTEDSDLDGTVVKGLEFKDKVSQYDKHYFETEVLFSPYSKAAKSNILGYVRLEKETWLKHSEHDDVLIPAGDYAIHQCRSWEANPKGIWTLRID